MSTTLNKLEYLDTTKGQIKTALNQFGSGITDSDTFRSYVSKINDIYDNWPKITGEATSVTLDNTKVSKLIINPKGNITQETREGYNLAKYPYTDTTKTENGMTFTDNGDGSITVNGTATASASFFFYNNKTLDMNVGENYTMIEEGFNNENLILDTYNSSYGGFLGTYTVTGNKTGTATQEDLTPIIRLRIPNGVTVTNKTVKIMIYKGNYDSTKPYEQYGASPSPSYPSPAKVIDGEYGVTVANSDNTQSQTQTIDTSPNPLYSENDYYYKQNGNWYVHNEWGKVVYTGASSESWSLQSVNSYGIANFFIAHNLNSISGPVYSLCNYFINQTGDISTTTEEGYLWQNNGAYFRIKSTTASDVTNFKTWLNTNNITLVYKLNNPNNTPITNTTLINQLEALSNMLAYQEQTNISQTHNTTQPDVIISASALKKGGN